MENPFEEILEKLERIETMLEKLKKANIQDDNDLLTRAETCELLKINLTTLWKHTKSGKLIQYGIGNRVFYKKSEILKGVKRIN